MNLDRQVSLGRAWPAAATLALALMLLAYHAHSVEMSLDKEMAPADGQQPVAPTPETGPPLIDWHTYTAAYNKDYSSWRQALVRQNLFTVKKLQVFLTAIKYRLNLLSYYMVINRYSDLTPEEERRKMSGNHGGGSENDDDDDDDDDQPLDDDDETNGLMDDETVRRLLMAELAETSYDQKRPDLERLAAAANKKQMQSKKRHPHKRSIDDQTGLSEQPGHPTPEALSLDDLVRMPDSSDPNDRNPDFGSALKIKWIVPSNNPDYKPMEQMSMGATFNSPDNIEKLDDVPEEDIEKIEKSTSSWHASVSSHLPNLGVVNFLSGSAKSTFGWLRSKSFNWRQQSLLGLRIIDENKKEGTTQNRIIPTQSDETKASQQMAPPAVKKDIVIKDWRETGCITPPIRQGQCMCCYAVTAISHLEWSFCMHQERVLTPLSVQYLLSCGPQMRRESNPKMNLQLHGCDRGRSWQAMYFIREYGAELAAHMPYLGRDTACPVEPGTPRGNKGYIRPNVKQQVRMYANTQQLDLALKTSPVIVNFHQPVDFFAYGGGMVGRCYPHGSHAMLIVGHGVENDKPYLIIKNSFGVDWGMRGYFKFDREYTSECVKDFIKPRYSFPSKKSQARHMKAYIAERQESEMGQGSSLAQENSVPTLDKIFDTETGGLL